MLRADGGVIDDLIVYFMAEDWFRMVVNAATTEKDLAWIEQQAGDYRDPGQSPRRSGHDRGAGPARPASRRSLCCPRPCATRPASSSPSVPRPSGNWFVGRTGYTGEDGFEIMLPAELAPAFWRPWSRPA